MEHLPTVGPPDLYVSLDDLIYVGPTCWYDAVETYKKYLAAGGALQPAFVQKREDGKYDMFWGIQQFEVYKALGYTELPCYLSTDPATWSKDSIHPAWLFIPSRKIDLVRQGITISTSDSIRLSDGVIRHILEAAIKAAEDLILQFKEKLEKI